MPFPSCDKSWEIGIQVPHQVAEGGILAPHCALEQSSKAFGMCLHHVETENSSRTWEIGEIKQDWRLVRLCKVIQGSAC